MSPCRPRRSCWTSRTPFPKDPLTKQPLPEPSRYELTDGGRDQANLLALVRFMCANSVRNHPFTTVDTRVHRLSSTKAAEFKGL